MVKFVLAPDSFKESMTAKEVCLAMEKGLRVSFPRATYQHVPMADGGEGTMQSLVDATGGTTHQLDVVGPLGKEVTASFGLLGDKQTAVIEMASASGLHLVPLNERNPLVTTTFGTGQLIKACLDRGVKKIIIGIGGSATNDGGVGMASALGASFLSKDNQPLPYGGGALGQLKTIDTTKVDKRLSQVEIIVACDVTNPLTGPAGATAIFGAQKGATPEMIQQLEQGLDHYGTMIESKLRQKVKEIPGAGAAGGLGAGLLAFTSAKLQKGIEIVIEYSGLEKEIESADFVLTGEGKIDQQTQYGKTPYGVASLANFYHKPVICLAGSAGPGVEELYEAGFTAIFSILQGVGTLEEALTQGPANIEETTKNIGKLMLNLMYQSE